MKQDAHFTSCGVTQSKSGKSLQTLFRVAKQRKDKKTGKMITEFIDAPSQNFAKSGAGKALCFPVTIQKFSKPQIIIVTVTVRPYRTRSQVVVPRCYK